MKLPETLTRSVGRTLLKTKMHSPHLLFGAGLVGIATTVVLACRATLKLEKETDDIKTDFQSVKMLGEEARLKNLEYTEQDHYRDLLYVYGKTALRVGKLYGPTVVVGVGSVALLTGSHVQLTRRNQALTITLAAVTKAFDEYRIRVQEEIGHERELDIYRGVREERIEGEKGLVKVIGENGMSMYSRIFDEGCINFKNSAELNRMFIQCQQAYANHLLKARGHVFLNDVYDQLGFDRTTAGAVVGWVLNGDGDGYIDFGMYDAVNMRYLDNYKHVIILDFNVDGEIYKLIDDL